jgi:signal transduction histidine kinase
MPSASLLADAPLVIAVLLIAALAGFALWQARTIARNKTSALRHAGRASALRDLLDSAPDGYFAWTAGGHEVCSARLAVLLDLPGGTAALFADVCAAFSADAAEALARAVQGLRREGLAFDLSLTTAGGRRLHAAGRRAGAGATEADVVWLSALREQALPTEPRPGDASPIAALVTLLERLPVPAWVRKPDLDIRAANGLAGGIPASAECRALARRARDAGTGQDEIRTIRDMGRARICHIVEAPLPGGGTFGLAVDRPAAPVGRVATAERDGQPQAVLDNLATAIAIFGADGRLQFYNGAYAALWRLDREWLDVRPDMGEVLERLREQRTLPETADFRTFKDDELSLAERLAEPQETLWHLPDGRTVRRVTSPQGGGGVIQTFEDVTDRLALERSFKILTAVQRATLDHLYEGIAVFGSDGRLKLCNPVFARLWGIAPERLNGDTHIADFVEHTRPYWVGIGDWAEHSQRIIARLLARAADSGRLIRSDGRVVDYANVPLPDGAVLLTYLDITDGFRVELALRQRAQALQEADRLKSEFIANVSHEIRTPLTSVQGFAEILAEEYFGQLNTRQKEYVQGIRESAQTLMTVVGDILDLATIEAGMLTLELDTVDLHSMLVAVLGLVRERARRKGIDLQFDCPPDIGWIVADERRLKQVFFNLLSNAVAFTPPRGRIGLAAKREADQVAIDVTDTGVGIPQADQDRVFRPFEGAGPGGSPTGGAGLGLSLVKRFIELHGGTVALTSAPRRGTRVTCLIPIAGPIPDGAEENGEPEFAAAGTPPAAS